MDEIITQFSRLLSDVILPNLKAVQASQKEQIAANDRLEQDIEELRVFMDAQFAHLSAQLTACRAEIAATQALLKATQEQNNLVVPARPMLIH
jgi:flagellar biosynthesis protein FliP